VTVELIFGCLEECFREIALPSALDNPSSFKRSARKQDSEGEKRLLIHPVPCVHGSCSSDLPGLAASDLLPRPFQKHLEFLQPCSDIRDRQGSAGEYSYLQYPRLPVM
jgi:hypothetical protein